MQDELTTALAEMGLTGYESAAYLALLGRSSFTPTELARRAKIPRQRVYDVLDSLEAKGLCVCRDTSPRTCVALDPARALEVLRERRVHNLERERQVVDRRALELMEELAPLYQAGRDESHPFSYIDVLADQASIAAHALELAGGTRNRLNSCIKRPLILNQEQNWRFIREPLSRGVDYRAVYEAAALEDEELSAWMATFSAWGQKIRVVNRLPLKMQAFDDEAVLLSMQDPVGGPPSFTAVAIRHRGMVEMMNLAFEALWESAEPVTASGRPSAAQRAERKTSSTPTAVFREGLVPGCIGRIIELHGAYYGREWGAGGDFEALMARELCDFCERYDPARDLLLTARVGDRLAGSVVIQAQAEPSDTWARLRWFIVDQAYQGRGIGRELLARALTFCRERGFPGVYLWTVTDLPQSSHLYQSMGFVVVEEIRDDRYRQPLVSLRLELPLPGADLP